MATTVDVHVWYNVKTKGFIPTGHFGHAALEIKGLFAKPDDRYISFWPKDGAGTDKTALKAQPGLTSDDRQQDMFNEMRQDVAMRLELNHRIASGIPMPDHIARRALAPRTGQVRLDEPFKDDDTGEIFYLWGQSPSNVTTLPGGAEGGKAFGLSTRRMGDWWGQYKATQPHYRAISRTNNCAGVAIMGLVAGGSEAILPAPTIMIYAEPLQVDQYAQDLLKEMTALEAMVRDIRTDTIALTKEGKVDVTKADGMVDGLWPLATWKSKSALGALQFRSGTVRDMDDAVEAFHKANWKDKFVQRYTALVKLIRAIHKHRQEKPESKRSEGIITLAEQAIKILQGDIMMK